MILTAMARAQRRDEDSTQETEVELDKQTSSATLSVVTGAAFSWHVLAFELEPCIQETSSQATLKSNDALHPCPLPSLSGNTVACDSEDFLRRLCIKFVPSMLVLLQWEELSMHQCHCRGGGLVENFQDQWSKYGLTTKEKWHGLWTNQC